MARFEPNTGLDEVIAVRYGKPHIERVLLSLRDSARGKAPPTRVWITARDERVRRTHVETDSQVVPDNLRFKLPRRDGLGYDMARHPRDRDLPIEQRANCRCEDPTVGNLLANSIHATDVDIRGTFVSGSVVTGFPRAAESEFGTDKDKPAHYMTNALREVAERLRATHP